MIEVTATVDINRPHSEVFAYLADMANNLIWQQGMQRCVWTSDPPLRVGSTYDQEARFLGMKIASSFEVVEFVQDEAIRIRTTSGTMPIDVTRTVRKLDSDMTAVSAVVQGTPGGLLGLATPITRRLVQASVQKDYLRLKTVLEA